MPSRLAPVLAAAIVTAILCAVAMVPTYAYAAVADAFEPDGSSAAASPIVVDAAAQQHTIFPEGDEDWVSFAVTAGQTYAIETASGTPAEDIDTVLYLYGADGTTQIGYNDDGGTGGYSLIEYAADSNTTVYAKVKGYRSDTTGAYALDVSAETTPVGDVYEPDDSSAAATPITIDAAAQQHTIHFDDDEDWVSFTVTAGRAYTIQTAEGTPADSMDTVLYLYDSDGMTLIEYNYDYEGSYSRIDYTADADKTLYAMVRNEDYSSVGAYALSVTLTGDSYEPDDSAAAATPIVVGGAVQQHSIDPEDDEDWVSFAVGAGLTYRVATGEGLPPESTDMRLELYDSDGATLLSWGSGLCYDEGSWADGTMEIVYTADADETIYARVRSYGTGTYSLGVAVIGDSFEPDGSAAAATPIAVDGAAQQHTIVPGNDQDWVSFTVEAGWRYAIETAPGTVPDDPDTYLSLYDSDGTTFLADNDDYEGYYSRIEYEADENKTVYARVSAYRGDGTYALSVTRTPITKIGVAPASIDFGEVAVGASLRRTVVVENQGVTPLDVGSVQLAGAGFSIVRDDAGDTTIPVGESREIELAYTPTAAYTGAPAAVQHDWTSLEAQYNSSSGILVSVSLYTGFQNVGGAGGLGWRVKIGAPEWTGTGAVVAGGKYNMRVVVSPGSGVLVQVLQPVSDSFNIALTGSSVLGVAYLRVPDAYLTIASNDDDDPTIDVDLFGVAVPAAPDSTPPTTTDDADDLWHNTAVTVDLAAEDNVGGSGMVGGLAKTEYSKDGGATWVTGTSATYAVWRRGGGSGLHTLLYRSTDAAGNLEATQSCTVKIDARAPLTSDDAPLAPQSGTVNVHLTAADSLFGVTACSGVAAVTYSLDGGAPQTVPGSSASIPVSTAGTHWISYFATDNAGNAEYAQWCGVTILAGRSARLPVRTPASRVPTR